ncbi:MAG: hypothetical protein DRJ03_01805 [Chloroflexi bacterium]|nr:MAG: hypothetical protein DRJ03_01805 [Chloroflexota bacterium]
MVDRISPLKIEGPASGGSQTDDFPTSASRNEDFVDCRGVTVQDDTSNDDLVRVSRDGDDMTFLDKNNTVKTLTELLASGGGLTPTTHAVLDQLVHALAEDYYEEYTRSGNKVTNITVWTDSGKTTKIREEQYTYTGNKITQEVDIQYDGSGVEVERLTLTYAYSGSLVLNVTSVRTP